MDPRIPKLLFLLLAVYAVFHFSAVYSQLPDVVASHFNAQGIPNGWQPKQLFFQIFFGVMLLPTVLTFAVPIMIRAMPPRLINLPNKDYWLSAEQHDRTMRYLSTWFAWFGCTVLAVIILTFDYAAQSNLHPAQPPDPARMGYTLVAFGLFTGVWLVRITRRFSRVDEK